MVVNITKISQKMQKKNWLNLEKILQNEKKIDLLQLQETIILKRS